MRTNPTPAEGALAAGLLSRGIRFYPQKVLLGYIADFYIPKARLILEVDGAPHDTPWNRPYDQYRDAVLASAGFPVLRFPNRRVLHDLGSVLNEIAARISPPQRTPRCVSAKRIANPCGPLADMSVGARIRDEALC
jgi:very-short-patch-repair endonuclease